MYDPNAAKPKRLLLAMMKVKITDVSKHFMTQSALTGFLIIVSVQIKDYTFKINIFPNSSIHPCLIT